MRITYTRGGLEDDAMRAYVSDPLKLWAEWFSAACDNKVSPCGSKPPILEMGVCNHDIIWFSAACDNKVSK